MYGYDIKIRLDNYRPLTWRDLIIPENITFHQLHLIMQELWDFLDYHLYQFTTKDYNTKFVNYEQMKMDNFYIQDYGEYDSNETFISEIFNSNKKVYYEYDFGDSWSFTIEIKNKIEYDNTFPYLKRFKGDYNPVEDYGGVYGLSILVENEDKNKDKLNLFDLEDKRETLELYCDFKNKKQ